MEGFVTLLGGRPGDRRFWSAAAPTPLWLRTECLGCQPKQKPLLWTDFNDDLELPAASFLFVPAALSLAWLGQLPFIRRLKTWQAAFIRLAAVLAPAAAGTALAWRTYSAF